MNVKQKAVLKWSAIVLLCLGLLAAALVAAGLQLAESRMLRQVAVAAEPVPYRGDARSVERGRYLFSSRGCVDCHGADGGGRRFIDDGALVVAGPQISPGARSKTAAYQPIDWVRVIRHGVKPDGRPAMVMPSEDYNRFSDDDLASLVAYVRQLPAVVGQPAVLQLPVPLRVLYGFGLIQDAAAKIDHALPPQQPVQEGLTAEHGRYVANMCIGCHGPGLAGGKIPGGPPDWPAAANLTPGSESAMARYPEAQSFARMFRTGKRPDGHAIGVMPFESLAEMNDVDVGALHLYLKTLPPREAGSR